VGQRAYKINVCVREVKQCKQERVEAETKDCTLPGTLSCSISMGRRGGGGAMSP
jgi:hypothetical protein